jgi:hypothetical protein
MLTKKKKEKRPDALSAWIAEGAFLGKLIPYFCVNPAARQRGITLLP